MCSEYAGRKYPPLIVLASRILFLVRRPYSLCFRNYLRKDPNRSEISGDQGRLSAISAVIFGCWAWSYSD